MSLLAILSPSMLLPFTLVHSFPSTFFLLLLLALLILLLSRLLKSQSQPQQKNHLKPCLSENSTTPSTSPMPSLVYQPPGNIQARVPSHFTEEQCPMDAQIESVAVKQPYDAFLVLDVEATCFQGTGFEWPNEIIVRRSLIRLYRRFLITRLHKGVARLSLALERQVPKGRASRLEIVGEFRSFVKPTWRPQLSQFCTDLTGITQAQVDYAPTFPKVLKMFARFLAQHGLIDPKNGRPLQRFCWCSDGPFDVRDFVVKQSFISNVPMPSWLRGDVLDVRKVVSVWAAMNGALSDTQYFNTKFSPNYHFRSLKITQQLRALRLGPFQGRVHSGIDDTRNIARIVIELARRGIRLEPNTPINPNKRWQWMGKPGEVLEYGLI
ncbi:ribonuclease H-like domain-containing protein [Chiua virens]|nr:ribonuclease H-like domain-containing protein [Chiua virens]